MKKIFLTLFGKVLFFSFICLKKFNYTALMFYSFITLLMWSPDITFKSEAVMFQKYSVILDEAFLHVQYKGSNVAFYPLTAL